MYTLFLGDKKIRGLLGDATKKETVLRKAVLPRKSYKKGSYSSRLGLDELSFFLACDWSVDTIVEIDNSFISTPVPAPRRDVPLDLVHTLKKGRTMVVPQGSRTERGELGETETRRMEPRSLRRILVNLKVLTLLRIIGQPFGQTI